MLDTRHGRVLLLDARTHDIWRLCRGLTAEEIAARRAETLPAVTTLLQALADVGLVTPDQGKWTAAAVRWV